MKTVRVIGIGAGDPDYLTMQAIRALNETDVFFVMDKGPAKQKLVALRKAICEQYITHDRYRIVEAESPERRRAPTDLIDEGYRAAVDDLNRDKQQLFTRLIVDELADGEGGAFLVWGDPSLYDSTIRILNEILAAGDAHFTFDVIPGITSVQALAARHKVPLNQIGAPFSVTTGRKIADGLSKDMRSAVVMLDAQNAFANLVDENLDIYWGAYVGTPDELLVAGPLHEVAAQIATVRAAARAANGWIMDTYILHRRDDGMDAAGEVTKAD